MRTHVRLLVAALVPLLAACDRITGPGDGVRFSMYITDAPGDVRAWASFSDIYIQGQGGRQSLLTGPTDLIELTALVGTVEQLVNDAQLPLGTGGEIRAVVDQAVLEDGDGSVYVLGGAIHPEGLPVTGALKCPSCSQSGIKIKLTGGGDELLLEEGATTLLLDFDVSQSFGRPAGKSGKWVMHPVIFGTVTVSQTLKEAPLPAGGIRGIVHLPFFNFVPQCPPGTNRDLTTFVPRARMVGVTDEDGNPVIRTGSTDMGGAFEIPFLAGGDYEMSQDAVDFGTHRLTFTTTIVPSSVHVEEDVVANGVTYFINSMACEAQ